MLRWSFNTVTDETGAESAGKWYWRANAHEPPTLVTSAQLFPTLDECAADARCNGFRGSVVPMGDSLCHPVMIGLEEPENMPLYSRRELASAIWV